MDVVLWVVIGVAAGLVITALAPEMEVGRTPASTRRGRNVAAGIVGAVGGASWHVWLNRTASGDRLTTTLAALAGALWLSAIVEVLASRRRRTEDVAPTVAAPVEPTLPTPLPAPVIGYHAARQAVVAGLIEDAEAHEAGRYAEIGRQFPAIRERVSHQDPTWNSRLQLALRFWRGWTLARDERWRASDGQAPLAVADWPRFARTIASDLTLDRDTMDPAIVGRFAYATPWRVQGPTTLGSRR